MINCGKNKMISLADKIDFYYINGNLKQGFLYSQDQHLFGKESLGGVSISGFLYLIRL